MPFKKSDDGKQLVLAENGMPIFIGSDGSEKPFDVDARIKQIAELTDKANKRGKEIDDLKAKYALLAEIDDLAAYVDEYKRNAEIVASLKDKEREKEENVQKRITEAIKGAVAPVALERDKLKAELETANKGLNKAVIGDSFFRSKYVAEKLVNSALAQQLFEGSFYVKDGKPVGRDANGNDIYGADGVAGFDEALSKLVEASPFKDNILKSSSGGSGSNNGGNSGANKGKITPVEAAKLSAEEFAKARKDGRI